MNEPTRRLTNILDSQPVPVEPESVTNSVRYHDPYGEVRKYIDALQSALKLAQEELNNQKKRAESLDQELTHCWKQQAEEKLRAEKAESELAALQLIGEVKEGGVVWANQNPHAYPIGTKFYCIQE